MRSFRSAYTALVVVVLPFGSALSSQESPPLTPPAVREVDIRDAGFATWRDGGADGLVASPFVLLGERYAVLVQSAVVRGRPNAASRLRDAINSCAAEFSLGEAAQSKLVAERAFQESDRAVAGHVLVALTIVPLGAQRVACAVGPTQEQSLLEFGVEFGRDPTSVFDRDAGSVIVEVGGTPVEPTLIARAAIRKIALGGYVGGSGQYAIRVYLPLEALVPAGAASDSVRLLIGNLVDEEPTAMLLPPALVHELRRELLGWRARRLAVATSFPPDMPVSLPRPTDPLLQNAHDRYQMGAFAEASVAAILRLDARTIGVDDRTSALMQLGITFASVDDVAAARLMFRSALEREPCLHLPATVAARYRVLLDAVRPVHRCTPIGALRIVRAGVVPGGVQRTFYDDRGIGIAQVMAMTGSAVAFVLLREVASRSYEEYRNSTTILASRYAKANQQRTLANIAVMAIWTSYAWPVARGLWEERRLARRLPSLVNYGASVRDAVSLEPASRGVGLAVFFF